MAKVFMMHFYPIVEPIVYGLVSAIFHQLNLLAMWVTTTKLCICAFHRERLQILNQEKSKKNLKKLV
jgi:hypothetical protein